MNKSLNIREATNNNGDNKQQTIIETTRTNYS